MLRVNLEYTTEQKHEIKPTREVLKKNPSSSVPFILRDMTKAYLSGDRKGLVLTAKIECPKCGTWTLIYNSSAEGGLIVDRCTLCDSRVDNMY